MSITITAAEFKAYFDRDQFLYGATVPSIRDSDIDRAVIQATDVWNEGLYPSETAAKLALNFLTAHFLTLDIEGGNSGGQPFFVQKARHADDIGETNHIPSWMKEGDFAQFITTFYGQKFLTLSKPYLDGVIASVAGGTRN